MNVQKNHIYRFSDSEQVFCGAAYEKFDPQATRVDCEECKAAKTARSQQRAIAARRALEARKSRESSIPVGFKIYD